MGDVYHLLASQARFLPDRPALTGPGRAPLTYARLLAQAEEVAARLNRGGVGRHDRVAIVLPNGPEMAAAFLSVAACATAAPLNPGFRAAELEFYLSDLQARALIVEAGKDSPARSVAHRLQIPIVELLPAGDSPAGLFTLADPDPAPAISPDWAQAEDIALLLHTSGTTARPLRVGVNPGGSLPECDAVVSHSRARRRAARVAGRRRKRFLLAGILCSPVLLLDGGIPAHLVHRRAHHAPSGAGARGRAQRNHCALPAPVHPFFVRPPSTASDGRSGKSVSGAGDRPRTR